MILPLTTRSDKALALEYFGQFTVEELFSDDYFNGQEHEIFATLTDPLNRTSFPELWYEDSNHVWNCILDEITAYYEYYYGHSGYKRLSPLALRAIIAGRSDIDSDIDSADFLTALDNVGQTLAPVIYKRFGLKWRKLYDALRIQYNPLENYSMLEVRTPDLTDERTPDLTDTKTLDLTDERTADLTNERTADLTDEKTLDLTDERTPDLTHNEDTDDVKGNTINSNATSKIYGYNSTTANPSTENEGSQTTTSHKVNTDTGTDTTTHTGTDTTTHTGTDTVTDTGTDTDTHTGTDTTTHTGTDTMTETGTDTQTHTGTDTVVRTGTETTTHTGTETLSRAGNIGVTTSQQMLQSEFEVRKIDLTDIIYNDIDKILCLQSY